VKPVTRSDIVTLARLWIDTPWHHMGRVPLVGLDCAGLLIALARTLGLVSACFDVPAYTREPDGKQMLALLRKFMRPVGFDAAQPGDAVCIVTDTYPQHLGVLAGYGQHSLALIHASNSSHPPRVIEHRLLQSRRLKIVAAFAFPGIE